MNACWATEGRPRVGQDTNHPDRADESPINHNDGSLYVDGISTRLLAPTP